MIIMIYYELERANEFTDKLSQCSSRITNPEAASICLSIFCITRACMRVFMDARKHIHAPKPIHSPIDFKKTVGLLIRPSSFYTTVRLYHRMSFNKTACQYTCTLSIYKIVGLLALLSIYVTVDQTGSWSRFYESSQQRYANVATIT